MDGTLLNSMPIWDTCCSYCLRSLGITPPPELDTLLVPLSYPERLAYVRKHFLPQRSIAEIEAIIDGQVAQRYEAVRPKEGVPALLAAFRAAGVPMAVATLTDRPKVERTLSRLGLLSYFSFLFTCDEVGEGKTSPRIYEEALAALGTPKGETPVFEDAIYAIRTAARAGFPVVAVYDKSRECRFSEAERIAALAVTDYRAVDWSQYLP